MAKKFPVESFTDTDYTEFKSNREKQMTPKKVHLFAHCDNCGLALVNPACKCHICGNVQTKRMKKEAV